MSNTEWEEENIIKYRNRLRVIDEEMQILNKILKMAEESLQEAWRGNNADLTLDKLLQMQTGMKKASSGMEQADRQLKWLLQKQTTEDSM